MHKISYAARFEEILVIENIPGIILDSIKIYGLKNTLQLGNVITQETDFYIRTINGKMAIYPVIPGDSYYFIATRVVNATKVTTKASDYVGKTVSDGNYNFAMKDDW